MNLKSFSEKIEHDYVEILGLPSNTYLCSWERKALDLNGWGPGSILIGVPFWCKFFFTQGTACEANIVIIDNCVCENVYIIQLGN